MDMSCMHMDMCPLKTHGSSLTACIWEKNGLCPLKTHGSSLTARKKMSLAKKSRQIQAKNEILF